MNFLKVQKKEKIEEAAAKAAALLGAATAAGDLEKVTEEEDAVF